MRCEEASVVLLELADGLDVPSGPRRAHVERCLRCQAELAQHRRISRSLAGMRSETTDPDPDLLSRLVAFLEAAAVQDVDRAIPNRHRAAYVAAATAATAAGAAGAVLLASRSRRTRLSPTG